MIVGVIDVGLGNVASVVNMIKKIGIDAEGVDCPDAIMKYDKVILPGVGAFDSGMLLLHKLGMIQGIKEYAASGNHLLGICLGMQLLFRNSEEGESNGLGLVDGLVERFNFSDQKLKIPHMGWNVVKTVGESVLLPESSDEKRFYHVHSYHVNCNDNKIVKGLTCYGYDFASVIEQENIFGVQFHPEKSHRFGMELLTCFLEY